MTISFCVVTAHPADLIDGHTERANLIVAGGARFGVPAKSSGDED
jgi:hypothetical protein